jgi:hypothetical protein
MGEVFGKQMKSQEVNANKNALVLFRGGFYLLRGRRTITDSKGVRRVQLLLQDERVKRSYVIARMEEVEAVKG